MKERIEQIIKEILLENDITLDTPFEVNTKLSNIGLTSFDLASLTVRIEDEFEVDIFEHGIITTFGEIIDQLNS